MAKNINTAAPKGDRGVSDRDLDVQLKKLSDEIRKAPKVKIRLSKDPANPDGAQYVAINGFALYIPRGVQVEVPYPIYQLLEQQGVV